MVDRRRVIGAALVGVAAGLAPHRPASAARSGQSFLLVHGAWHGAQHWNLVTEQLAARGHRVLAIDLPGYGLKAHLPQSYMRQDLAVFASERSPVADVTLDDYVATVLENLRRLAADGKVTLVGHSMAGAVITRVGETAPELIERLIYLTAYCPVQLPHALAYNALPERAGARDGGLAIGDPKVIGAVRINPHSVDRAYLEEVRQTFYQDVPSESFLAFANSLVPDLPLRVVSTDARGTPQRWGAIPRSYIRCTEDRALPIALQDRMIREADAATPGNSFVLKTLASSHSPFASQPARLAEVLEAAGSPG